MDAPRPGAILGTVNVYFTGIQSPCADLTSNPSAASNITSTRSWLLTLKVTASDSPPASPSTPLGSTAETLTSMGHCGRQSSPASSPPAASATRARKTTLRLRITSPDSGPAQEGHSNVPRYHRRVRCARIVMCFGFHRVDAIPRLCRDDIRFVRLSSYRSRGKVCTRILRRRYATRRKWLLDDTAFGALHQPTPLLLRQPRLQNR